MDESVMKIQINVEGDGQCKGLIAVSVCYNGVSVSEEDIPKEVGQIIEVLKILPYELADNKTTCPTCAGVGLVD